MRQSAAPTATRSVASPPSLTKRSLGDRRARLRSSAFWESENSLACNTSTVNSSLSPDATKDLLDRLLTAIAAGDVEAVREIYAPDAVIRNNYMPEPMPIEDFLTALGHMHSVTERMWFEPIRFQVTESGFVDEHVARFRTHGGADIALVSCMVAEIRDGRIASVSDYANAGDMEPLNAELMAKLAD